MSRLFISHSSQDDAFVRELRGSGPPWAEIEAAIDASSGWVAVVNLPSSAGLIP